MGKGRLRVELGGITPATTGRRITSRLSTGHVVMIVAGLLGVVLTLSVLRQSDEGPRRLVAATDLAPGTVIDADAVRAEPVDASASVLGGTFGEYDLGELRGQVVTAPISKGALVARDAVRPRREGGVARSMSFPLPMARAMGSALESGDRVDVIAVHEGGTDAAYVMTDAEVLDVDGARGGPLGAPDDVTITLAVDADAAIRVATALEAGPVTLVRSTGAMPAAVATPERGGEGSDG